MQALRTFLIKFPSINFISILNKILKDLFLPKTLKHYDDLGEPYGIIINDNMLKFHNNDIRKKIRKELLK